MLNFIIIFTIVIWIPGCILYFIVKYIIWFFKEIKKEARNIKEREVEDTISYKSLDGTIEYHQYSFYSPWSDSDRWKRYTWIDFEMAREIDPLSRLFSFYYKFRYPEKSEIFRQSEIIHSFQNARIDIKDKVVIIENHSKIKRLLMKLSILSIYLVEIIFAICIWIFLYYAWRNDEILSGYYATLFIKVLIILILLMIIFWRNYNILKIQERIKKQWLESLNFENNFDAFSADPIVTRMIINPAFMDKLEIFSKKYNLQWKIRAIFMSNTLTFIYKWDIWDLWLDSDWKPLLLTQFKNECGLDYFFINK